MFEAGAIFLAVFIVVVLLYFALTDRSREEARRTGRRLEEVRRRLEGTGEPETDLRRHDTLSNIAWFDELLRRAEFSTRARDLLYQADLNWTVGALALTCAACGMLPASLVYLRTHNTPIAIVIGMAFSWLPLLYVRQRRSRRFEQFEQRLPEALDMIVGALRAGHSLFSAFSLVARESPEPIGREFRKFVEEQNFGVELRTALENMSDRVPIQDMRIVVTAILIQKETGGNLAEVLEKAAFVIRERFRLKRQIRVHTAQGRLTGWILAVLPLILGMLLYVVNPDHMSILWKKEAGVKLIYASAVMTTIGGLIIRRIIRVRV